MMLVKAVNCRTYNNDKQQVLAVIMTNDVIFDGQVIQIRERRKSRGGVLNRSFERLRSQRLIFSKM